MKPAIVGLLIWLAASAAAQDTASCVAALDRGEYRAAAREAETLLKKYPRSAGVLVLLARAEIGANNAPAALNHLRRAFAAQPDNLDALYYLSKLAAVLSQQQLGYVLERAPDSARAHQIRAEILVAQDKIEEAEREYRTALEKRPGTPALLIALGDLKRQAHDYKGALSWYSQAMEKAPRNYDAVYGAGASYWFLREREDAARLFRLALKIDPSSMAAKLALGEALLALGDNAASLKLLEQAAAVDPNLRRLQLLLMRAYRAEGREEDARRAGERYRVLAAQEEKSEEEDFMLRQKP